MWQFISRWTWEILQTSVGLVYSHGKNICGEVDRVDHFHGATFVTNEHTSVRQGVSLGNYLNLDITGEITGDFETYVTRDPMFMHEFGHTFDSGKWGVLYIPAIGIPSAISADNQKPIANEPAGITTHDFRIYEMRANKYAAEYFGQYFGVNWDNFETQFPRNDRRTVL